MPKTDEYVTRIKGFSNQDLLTLWEQIRESQETGFPPGKALEYLVLRAFDLEGAEVTWPFEVRESGEVLEQIDGFVYTDGLYCLIEAKDRSDSINVEPIYKLRSQLLRRPASVIGAIFSRNGFTQPAKRLGRFAFPQTILLWDREDIELGLQRQWMRHGLRRKFRYAAELSLADYNLKEEAV